MLKVVENIKRTQVQPGPADYGTLDQGARTPPPQRESSAQRRDHQPAVSEGRRLLECDVLAAVVACQQASVGKPGRSNSHRSEAR